MTSDPRALQAIVPSSTKVVAQSPDLERLPGTKMMCPGVSRSRFQSLGVRFQLAALQLQVRYLTSLCFVYQYLEAQVKISSKRSLSSHNPFRVPQNTPEVGGQKTRLCRLGFYF